MAEVYLTTPTPPIFFLYSAPQTAPGTKLYKIKDLVIMDI